MRRLAFMVFAFLMLGSPAFAITEFSKHWKEKYLGDEASAEFKRDGRKAGCYICHVKGEKKEEARNEYGIALKKFLDAEKFPKERIKAEPEVVKKEILEGFEKAGLEKSTAGPTFAEKIKAGKLPADDAGL